MASDNFILTQEGREKLEEELRYLENEKRAEVGERIRVAREFGDITENSEYDDAKNEQGMVEARIAEIGCSLPCLYRKRDIYALEAVIREAYDLAQVRILTHHAPVTRLAA